MPASRRSLELQDRYAAELSRLWTRVVAVLRAAYRNLDRDDLQGSFRAYLPVAAETIALGQQRAITLAQAYVAAYVASESDERIEIDEQTEAGTTFDGRAVEEALSATPAKVFLALKAGRPVEQALAFGEFSVARLASTEIADAARREVSAHVEQSDAIKGWRWRSVGTCLACLSMDDGNVRAPGTSLNAHPGCQCIQEPVVAGVKERVKRPTGRERFFDLSESEQDGLYGKAKAQLIRTGAVAFYDDLAKREQSNAWRAVISEVPLKDIKEG